MRKINKVKNLAGLLDLASVPQYQNGGETTLEVTLPEIEVYGDQLRRDMQRTGLTYDELTNLNYGAQRQSQIQGGKQPQEIEINPITGNPSTRHGDFLYDNIINNIIAHEWQHVLDNIYRYHLRDLLVDEKIPGFNNNAREYFVGNYGTELAARGTQLKNYFGITDSYRQKITPEMLKYAKEFYVKDTGLDNNMTEFFEEITDYDEFAKWLSKAAYSEGGIHIKKKNRGKFTETMKRTGKTAEELKHSKNPLTRKRAVFAINSRRWAKKK